MQRPVGGLNLQRQVFLPGRTRGALSIDGVDPCCFTLEDTVRDEKVAGETAIPAGEYACRPREAGRLFGIYSRRWPSWHLGMIHLQDVPGFEWIYLHAGGSVKDTLGCVLVGYTFDMETARLGKSRRAYERVYTRVVTALYADDLVIRVD